jgi:hypothetical protein
MGRRLSWVEWLAFGLIGVAVVVLLFGAEFFKRPLPSDDPTAAIWRAGFASVTAAFIAARVAAVGFSLFLVQRLSRLRPRALLWVIPIVGVALGIFTLVVGTDSVCLGIGRTMFFACDFGLSFVWPILIGVGTVSLIRSFQSFPKREPVVDTEQSL